MIIYGGDICISSVLLLSSVAHLDDLYDLYSTAETSTTL